MSATGHVTGGAEDPPSVEDRLRALEQRVDSVEERLATLPKEIGEELEQSIERRVERAERWLTSRIDRLEKVALGEGKSGADRLFLSVTLLVLGLAAATAGGVFTVTTASPGQVHITPSLERGEGRRIRRKRREANPAARGDDTEVIRGRTRSACASALVEAPTRHGRQRDEDSDRDTPHPNLLTTLGSAVERTPRVPTLRE